MRRPAILILLALTTFPATAAELHQATPLPVLLERLGIKHHGHHPMHVVPAVPAAASTRPVAGVEATARTFNIDAVRFSFGISPSPFVVNQGDDVTLLIEAQDTTHGFFMERYDESGAPLAPGQLRTVRFVANTAGTFTFFCTFVCGEGHGSMNGVFTVNAVQSPPSIASISPASGPAGGGTSVVITGSNFQNGATVKFGDTPAVTASVSGSTSMTAVAPARPAGKVIITVTNTDGLTATFDGYTYLSALPTVAAISPASGPATGGTTINITGSNFQNGATVRFGNTPASSVTFVNSGQLTVVAPPAGVGSVTVTITNPNGDSVTVSYLYTGPIPARRRASRP